ncbi:hypothetical protein [Synechococcus sp. CS-1328]|uniref:hypothetical protein n=1 Tax=Synechococcus sp. CS-1328 TaxID=2847976 RepID=UPI00223B031E|nr:hypothetical protein [Synechococcus sp. CS-1328]
MATIQSPLQRCNAVLRALGSRYRLREHSRSPWLTVYELGAGGRTRECSVPGYAAADPRAVEALQERLIEATRSGQPPCCRGHGVPMFPNRANPAGQRSVKQSCGFSAARA